MCEEVSHAGGKGQERSPDVREDLVMVPEKPALSLQGLVNWVAVCRVHIGQMIGFF